MKGARILWGLLVGVLVSYTGLSQENHNLTELIDSLKVVASTMKNDTNKVTLLNRLSFECNTVHPNDGIRYGIQAHMLAEELDYKAGMARANSSLGANYFSLSDYPNAYDYWLKALSINRETNNKFGVANHLHNIGMVLYTQKDYERALEYYNKALEVSLEMGNQRFATNTYTAIGNIYAQKKEYTRSLEFHFKALGIDTDLGNQKSISSDLLNIGSVYCDQGDFARALETLEEALRIKKTITDKNGITKAYNLLGKVHFQRAKKDGLPDSDLLIAQAFLDSAIMAGEQIGYLESLQSSHQMLSEIFEIRGDLRNALKSAKSYHAIKDSIFSVSRQTEIFNLDKKATKAEQDKKDALANQELQKQKLLRNAFVGGFGVVLLFAFVFFAQRNRIAKGKRRSDELLLNILPEEVANELKAKGSADARSIDNVTVLFTDFKGFTELSEKLTPKELVAEIDECFSVFDTIMQKHGVEKIKTIGDAYMAAGGLPTANSTHPHDVVQAALDIQFFMKAYRIKRESEGRLFFEIRIGVHSGPVIAGIVGLNKFAYDIWGDTVNTASRMESGSEPGKVNISGTTHYYVKNSFNCIHRGKIQAKGKGEIDMYFVEA